MKELFVSDLFRSNGDEVEVELFGWIGAKRCQGKVIFLDVCDSTGRIQVVVAKSNVIPESFQAVKRWSVESGVALKGVIIYSAKGQREIVATSIILVGDVSKNF